MLTAMCETCCIVQGAQLGAVVTQMGGMEAGGGKEVQEGEDICIHIADLFYCTAETNTTL